MRFTGKLRYNLLRFSEVEIYAPIKFLGVWRIYPGEIDIFENWLSNSLPTSQICDENPLGGY